MRNIGRCQVLAFSQKIIGKYFFCYKSVPPIIINADVKGVIFRNAGWQVIVLNNLVNTLDYTFCIDIRMLFDDFLAALNLFPVIVRCNDIHCLLTFRNRLRQTFLQNHCIP